MSPCHAAIIIDQDQGILLVDLFSTHGTFLDDVQLVPLVPKQLQIGSIIKFGEFKITYKIEGIDYSRM